VGRVCKKCQADPELVAMRSWPAVAEAMAGRRHDKLERIIGDAISCEVDDWVSIHSQCMASPESKPPRCSSRAVCASKELQLVWSVLKWPR
jgi:hypothetical protein